MPPSAQDPHRGSPRPPPRLTGHEPLDAASGPSLGRQQESAHQAVAADEDPLRAPSGPFASRGIQGFVFTGLALALCMALLDLGQPVLLPLAFAALLAFVLNPLVTFLQSMRLPRAAAVAISVLLALSVLTGATLLAAQQVLALSTELPAYRSNVHTKLTRLRPALSQPGVMRELSRMLGMVENEIDAARKVLNEAAQPRLRAPTKVWVEAAPPSAFRSLAGWVQPIVTPLVTVGLVVVLLSFMLLQRTEMLDRFVKLMGGDMHGISDAMAESARRVSRYLAAQLLVNAGYGLPLALGLWWIGVPGAWLWGGLAVVLRFVPYLGPALAAVFPLLFAFAMDPGWSMVFWVLGWILLLELITNNVVEPLAYGGSTGVSPVAVLLSAAFWALLWGPVGLVVATPLTVCLVVIGQHLKPIRFLGLLLSSEPVFDTPKQLYRRLISGDFAEAQRMCKALVQQGGAANFYARAGLPMLSLAAATAPALSSAMHRHRVVTGTTALLATLRVRDVGLGPAAAVIWCVGVRDELDTLSAEMAAHALRLAGVPARALPLAAMTHWPEGDPSLDAVQHLWLCTFDEDPQPVTRLLVRRIRGGGYRHQVGLVAWRPCPGLSWPGAAAEMDVETVMTCFEDLQMQAQSLTSSRVASLHTTTPLTLDELAPRPTSTAAPAQLQQEDQQEDQQENQQQSQQQSQQDSLSRVPQRVQHVFAVPLVTLMLTGQGGPARYFYAGIRAWAMQKHPLAPMAGSPLDHVMSSGEPLVSLDLTKDPRFAGREEPQYEGLPALIALPLTGPHSQMLGVLALHHNAGQILLSEELELFRSMAREVSLDLRQMLVAAQPARSRKRPRIFDWFTSRFRPAAAEGVPPVQR